MCRVLSMFLKVDNVGAERLSSWRLFQATGPVTQNAWLPSCMLVLVTNKSPRATERITERLASGTLKSTQRKPKTYLAS